MRKFLLLLSFFCCTLSVFAQTDGADECADAISLGEAPNCPDNTVYSNSNATASVLPFDNTPVCFTTTPDNDVWFTFTTPADGSIIDFTVQLLSSNDNDNGIQNPQIAVYRIDGSCDELAEYDCASAADGNTNLSIDLPGLTPGEIYYLRINDYSATGTPNSGEFTLCVSEFVPFFNMCQDMASSSCFGTLYDSGGPDGDYMSGENCVFTICPDAFNECIVINIADYNLENNFDELIFYAGNDTDAPVISTLSGAANGNLFEIQTDSDCITIQMTTDGSGQQEGFALSWQCSSLDCDSSLDDITVISGLPFESDNLTTCDNAATFQETACGTPDFMAGPEAVFTYTTDGMVDDCYTITIENAAAGTGVLVLNGPPDNPASECVAVSTTSTLGSADLSAGGTYYIIVANADGCTDFDISIQPGPCLVNPSLENALCNPINGCAGEDGLPTQFSFSTDFFQDIPVTDANDGCWGGPNAANFYWFTMEAAVDGPFGFIFNAADPAEASDIDFNVWGPFTNEGVCGNPDSIINIISTTEPLASSYSGGQEPTGLIDIHPDTGVPQTELYDCEGVDGSLNDDFVSTIATTQGEVYVVLVNDWQGNILSGMVEVDFSPSGDGVLDAPNNPTIAVEDAEICQGVPVQLEVEGAVGDITWSPSQTLSCNDCPDPIANPQETTEYTLTISGVCYSSESTVTVNVYNADAGPDLTVCDGETIEIVAGQIYEEGNYFWTGPEGTIEDAETASPLITPAGPGTYTYNVTLVTEDCVITDQMILTVVDDAAAQYVVSDDVQLCNGGSYELGGSQFPNTSYSWVSEPAGFTSNEANPTVFPEQTTTYYLTANNTVSNCIFPSVDSVTVEVFQPVALTLNPDIGICLGDTTILSILEAEEDAEYLWTPSAGIVGDPTQPNVSAVPQETTTYTLTATRGVCVTTEQITVTVSEILINIDEPAEDVGICVGETVDISATALPANINVVWTPSAGLTPPTGTSVVAAPTEPTLYFATVETEGCVRTDSIFIDVDSLPESAVAELIPQKDVYCEGEVVTFVFPVYEPADYPDIMHQWFPLNDDQFESADTLWNMVISTLETTTFYRETVNGFCEVTDSVTIEVIEIPDLTLTIEPTEICAGETVQLQLTSEAELTSITWESEEAPLSCDDCENPTSTPFETTIYSASAETEEGDCPLSAGPITVTVNPLPAINVTATPSLTICPGDGAVIINAGNDADNFIWTDANGNVVSTSNLFTASPEETTTYTISATNDAGDCGAATEQVTVFVINAPTIAVQTDADLICPGDEIDIIAVGNISPNNISWEPTGQSGVDTISVSPTETTTYTATTTECGVTVSDEITVEVSPQYVIDSITVNPQSVFEGELVTLTAFTTPAALPGATYVWSFNGIEIETQGMTITVPAPDFTADPSEETQEVSFSVVVLDAAGCDQSAESTFEIMPSVLEMPNVFTPNNDELNDFFNPVFSGTIELLSFSIYNRWGQEVYNNETPETGWDGMYNEKPAPADVYVYVVQYTDVTGTEVTEKGDVTLLR